ncbi:MAG: hypothetical protein ACR2FY_24995 [Pirellulaceae bacterium]
MSENVLDDADPSPETVRRWAYNDDLVFIEQDEDLILHDTKYVPLLLEFASDPSCPKGGYSLGILEDFGKLQLRHRTDETLEIAAHARRYLNASEGEVKAWATDFVRAFEMLVTPKAISDTDTEWLARYLIKYGRQFCKTGRLLGPYTEFKAWTDSYAIFLYVNQNSGIWKHSTYQPLP